MPPIPLPRNGPEHGPTASFTVTRTAEASVIAVAGELDIAVTDHFTALVQDESA